MLKYLNTEITFAEVPDEITLCINITGCPNYCHGCHSQFLWKDVGAPLTTGILDIIIPMNRGISCICFMGGDQAPSEVNALAKHIKKSFPYLKTAWYSGKEEISAEIDIENFNYIKIGPYMEKLGGLDNLSTNQRFYKIMHSEAADKMLDITNKFWKKMTKNFDFGIALACLKEGSAVRREGWNGKGMYIWLLPKSDVKREWVKDPHLLAAFGDKETLECGYCIRMKNAQGTVDTWHPSIPDLFAEDWQLVE